MIEKKNQYKAEEILQSEVASAVTLSCKKIWSFPVRYRWLEG